MALFRRSAWPYPGSHDMTDDARTTDKPLIPAATILMLRDGPSGLEVFMVVRHHQIDFASGALVPKPVLAHLAM